MNHYLAVHCERGSDKLLCTPVVIQADTATGPAVTAVYLRDAAAADLPLSDWQGFDFGASPDRYFTGNPDLIQQARTVLKEKA